MEIEKRIRMMDGDYPTPERLKFVEHVKAFYDGPKVNEDEVNNLTVLALAEGLEKSHDESLSLKDIQNGLDRFLENHITGERAAFPTALSEAFEHAYNLLITQIEAEQQKQGPERFINRLGGNSGLSLN